MNSIIVSGVHPSSVAGEFSIHSLNNAYRKTPAGDVFIAARSKVNPAKQNNPIHSLNDAYLARILPYELVKKYTNPNLLSKINECNPNISQLLKQVHVCPTHCRSNISNGIFPHFVTTRKAAHLIMKNSKSSFGKEDYSTISKAALLHDVGKAYIPKTILEKKGALDTHERNVIDMHSRLGYEILKTAGVEEPVLSLVRDHHYYSRNNPELLQILEVADIWSALKEKRSYKPAFSDSDALKILYERSAKGDFDVKHVDALARGTKACM